VNALLAKLPPWLRPLESDHFSGLALKLESLALLAVAVLLAVVAFNDIFWSVQDAGVLVADQNTWRHYTHHDYYNVSAGRLVFNLSVDVSCANATPGPPGERTQICVIMQGPARHGLRQVIGGWRIPPRKGDFPRYRYACFGAAARSRTYCPNG
jgi:hypothetical protein